MHDASGKVIPGQDNAPIGNAIAQSGADIVWASVNAATFAEMYGAAVAQGFEALWSGAAPTWSPAFVAPDSPIKDAIDRDYYVSSYFPPLTDDTPGMAEVRALIEEYAPDAPRNDYLIEGIIEGMILFEALNRAYERGDMTQAGVLAAAKSIEDLDFGGIAPNESYVGSADERLQRKVWISRPDPEGLAAGTTGYRNPAHGPCVHASGRRRVRVRRGVLQTVMSTNGSIMEFTAAATGRPSERPRLDRMNDA